MSRSRARSNPSYWAFVLHRVSGIFLVFFLPVHFWTLSQALAGQAALDAALRWTQHPLLVAGEWAIVVLLAAHLTGGVRILILELLPWRDWAKTLLALAFGATAVIGLVYALALGYHQR